MNSKSASEVNLFDLKTQQCPYEAYKTLRNEAPVYQCPATGMYVITRFEDVRQILTDTEHHPPIIGSIPTKVPTPPQDLDYV